MSLATPKLTPDQITQVCDSTVTLPSCFALNYEDVLSIARAEGATNIGLFLKQHLPSRWSELYLATVARESNIVRMRCGPFEYLYDLYSKLEIAGEIPFDQTAKDRVVAVLGTSAPANTRRAVSRMRSWPGEPDELLGANRDNGHFIAHCIGGGLDVNVCSQDRELNRGWSPQGKIYRQMEKYCQEHAGTFCFSRPIYADSSSVPRWLEFGILKEDEILWVEVFENVV